MKISILKFLFAFIIAIFTVNLNVNADGMPQDTKNNPSTISKETKAENDKTGSAYALNDMQLRKFQYCGKDSDCIKIINGCCQCLQGDEYTSINKERVDEFRKMFDCNKVKCPEDSVDYSCEDGLVSCINHRCRFFSSD